MRWRSGVLSVVVIFGMSCLPRYRVPEIQPRAEFVVAVQNDSQRTTSRNVYLDVLKDEECHRHEYGMRANWKMANDSMFATDATTIAAGGRSVFSATYMNWVRLFSAT